MFEASRDAGSAKQDIGASVGLTTARLCAFAFNKLPARAPTLRTWASFMSADSEIINSFLLLLATNFEEGPRFSNSARIISSRMKNQSLTRMNP